MRPACARCCAAKRRGRKNGRKPTAEGTGDLRSPTQTARPSAPPFPALAAVRRSCHGLLRVHEPERRYGADRHLAGVGKHEKLAAPVTSHILPNDVDAFAAEDGQCRYPRSAGPRPAYARQRRPAAAGRHRKASPRADCGKGRGDRTDAIMSVRHRSTKRASPGGPGSAFQWGSMQCATQVGPRGAA